MWLLLHGMRKRPGERLTNWLLADTELFDRANTASTSAMDANRTRVG
jgi:hypothetical protein